MRSANHLCLAEQMHSVGAINSALAHKHLAPAAAAELTERMVEADTALGTGLYPEC